MTKNKKRETIFLRIESHAKSVIEDAAALMGTTVNAFPLHFGYQAALEILRESHLEVTERDWNRFIHALEKPPKPNANLKKLFNSKSPLLNTKFEK